MAPLTTEQRRAIAQKAAATRRRNRETSAYGPQHAPVPFQSSAPVISLRIVRDADVTAPPQLRSPADGYALLKERFGDADREVMVTVILDTRNKVLAIHPVYYGSLNSALIRINEVFKAAIALGAAAILVAHNHPSGDPTPSPDDIRVTSLIVEAGRLLDIECIDHLILGATGFVSLRERGLGFAR